MEVEKIAKDCRELVNSHNTTVANHSLKVKNMEEKVSEVDYFQDHLKKIWDDHHRLVNLVAWKRPIVRVDESKKKTKVKLREMWWQCHQSTKREFRLSPADTGVSHSNLALAKSIWIDFEEQALFSLCKFGERWSLLNCLIISLRGKRNERLRFCLRIPCRIFYDNRNRVLSARMAKIQHFSDCGCDVCICSLQGWIMTTPETVKLIGAFVFLTWIAFYCSRKWGRWRTRISTNKEMANGFSQWWRAF